MEKRYNLNELAMMTGFTTRTLRTYISQGLLQGEKTEGVWQFTEEEVDRFFAEPFVKEGLRIKRNSQVFDFMGENNKKSARTCVILDLPATRAIGDRISAFFCEEMSRVTDAVFSYEWRKGQCRVILSGAAEQVAGIMKAYEEKHFDAYEKHFDA